MNIRGMTGIRHTVVESAVGPLTLVATDGVLSGLFMETQARRPPPTVFGERDATPFPNIIEQLGEYFAGDRIHFDVELAACATPFQTLRLGRSGGHPVRDHGLLRPDR